ncbi:MAG: sel1 repeat family protein [Rhizobiaceae bacterium]|nr:sel1 repeat family protein [Rhizobiaceae bacterium]
MSLAKVLHSSFISAALAGCLAGGVEVARAQEGAVTEKSSPWDVFKFGFTAYKSGHKDQAIQAYRDASEQGQIGATWKLARMYAEGDGVTRDDYEAYKYFAEIVSRDVEPGSSDERFVGDALAEMGRYVQDGIPGTPVLADPDAAREYFQRAANYGSPIGQFEVGKMYLQRAESSPSKLRLAGRWLKLAAKNGHEGARAMLGNLLFQSGKVVDGLAMMTTALERAEPSDRPWIRSMQEEAFAVTEESIRRKAIDRADEFSLDDQR